MKYCGLECGVWRGGGGKGMFEGHVSTNSKVIHRRSILGRQCHRIDKKIDHQICCIKSIQIYDKKSTTRILRIKLAFYIYLI